MWLCLGLSVWPGITCMAPCVQTVQESGRGNDIITECVRVNHEIVCWMNNKSAPHLSDVVSEEVQIVLCVGTTALC